MEPSVVLGIFYTSNKKPVRLLIIGIIMQVFKAYGNTAGSLKTKMRKSESIRHY